MSDGPPQHPRRSFLKLAGALAASAAVGCRLENRTPETQASAAANRDTGFDRAILGAVGEVVLPSELGERGRDAAIGRFIDWADGYDPVAEEMHGYGYADIRYLPPDPSPAWRAQLAALEILAQKTARKGFAALDAAQRRALLTTALQGHGGARLPAPLEASHVALALVAHWAASPEAWDLAWQAKITPASCRVLDDATPKPLPLTGIRA
jgi:Gluconate 2-dehydrogenase subunit 3